jgi:hypothetical protein
MSEDERGQESAHSRDIPSDVQNVSTQELVDNNYEVDMGRGGGVRGSSGIDPDVPGDRGRASAVEEPGRTQYDDSVAASSSDDGRSDEGYEFETKSEMSAATQVGKEGDDHYDDWFQTVNDNRDRYEGSLGKRQNEWDKKRISEAICSQLPISDLQREKVLNAMELMNMERFGQQKAIERVCLGTTAVIVNEERVDQADSLEEVTSLTWEDEFKAITEPHGISMSDMGTIKEIVREELEDKMLMPVTVGAKRDPNLPKMSTSDLPDEHWDRFSPRVWEQVARSWEEQDEEYREAVPDDYRDLIQLLRNWEPWNLSDSTNHEIEGESGQSDSVEGTSKSAEEAVEGNSVDETIRTEVDSLFDEVDAEDR